MNAEARVDIGSCSRSVATTCVITRRGCVRARSVIESETARNLEFARHAQLSEQHGRPVERGAGHRPPELVDQGAGRGGARGGHSARRLRGLRAHLRAACGAGGRQAVGAGDGGERSEGAPASRMRPCNAGARAHPPCRRSTAARWRAARRMRWAWRTSASRRRRWPTSSSSLPTCTSGTTSCARRGRRAPAAATAPRRPLCKLCRAAPRRARALRVPGGLTRPPSSPPRSSCASSTRTRRSAT